jgi:hypothetical protein
MGVVEIGKDTRRNLLALEGRDTSIEPVVANGLPRNNSIQSGFLALYSVPGIGGRRSSLPIFATATF